MGLFDPWRRIATVDKINLDELRAQGIRLILIDRDNTCVPRDTFECSQEILEWINRAKAMGMKVRIVSNNFHTKQIEASAKQMGIGKIDHAMKPCPAALLYACKQEGVPREQTVMIGDQIFTDVLSGRFAGIKTILVKPQSYEDLWYTQLFRKAERIVAPDAVFEEEDN